MFSWRNNPLFYRAAGLSHLLVAANPDIAKQLTSDSKLSKMKVITCEDGVDTEMFHPSPLPEELTASWCGNSASGGGLLKGLDLARAACEREGVRLLTADREVNPIPHDRITNELYARSSFGLYPSSGEGTPNPLLETMACGRPVVITPVGLAPWLIQDGVNGVIIGERTVDGVAEAIRKVRTMNLVEAGRLARAAVEPFDWKHKVRCWSEALQLAESD